MNNSDVTGFDITHFIGIAFLRIASLRFLAITRNQINHNIVAGAGLLYCRL